MTALTDGDKLQWRMQRIRNRMHAKVDGLRLDAESLLDWRYYVCQFPLSSVLSAAVVGFWLTPGHRVTPTVKLDNRTIDNLVDRSVLQMESRQPAKAVWWKSLIVMGVSFAAKSALAYAGQRLLGPSAATRTETAETMR